jgi:hypothetical protein
MEYTVIDAINLNELVRKITEWMDQGWRPQGGVAVGSNGGNFYQAMIRER